jgi:diketogulonate reductase-like aldo/keto reductase
MIEYKPSLIVKIKSKIHNNLGDMSEKNQYITLNNGHKMPILGYGTFSAEEEKDLHKCLVHAVVDLGYRHIDTATLYGNEEIIGEALQEIFEKGIKREELFITTKLWSTDHKDAEGALKTSLAKLKLDYVDLYLIHFTVPDVDWTTFEIKGPSIHKVWSDLEKLNEAGLAKSIGVSNCSVMLFLDIAAGAKIRPAVNQIESNPYFSQTQLIETLRKFGCETTAYAPIGAATFTGNNVLKDETLIQIAEKHNATPAQIALAWNIQRGVSVIPKSTQDERIKKNFEALDIKLDEEDIEQINRLNKDARHFDPANWTTLGFNNSPVFA